jgi:hypothetical protein
LAGLCPNRNRLQERANDDSIDGHGRGAPSRYR